jgi:hypothetical protein
MAKDKEDKDMSTVLNKKYADLKGKLNQLTELSPTLKGRDGMVELDPNNPQHREWYEEDKYKEE